MSILIFANGDEPGVGWGWVQGYLSQDSILIAVDGGARHLDRLNLRPHVVIGDLDSLDAELQSYLLDRHVELITAPQDKDETDLELALVYAAKNHEGPILIFGGTGGRLDQTLSNILLLSLPELDGREVIIVEPHQKVWIVESETTIVGKQGDLVSLIAHWGKVRVWRTEGLKWPLQNEWLHPGPARGVSNIMTEDRASIEISDGRVLCIHTDKNWKR
ncbi:MAG: thiamine diphosphokinase [Candidatus Promineifilaceae bacterium]